MVEKGSVLREKHRAPPRREIHEGEKLTRIHSNNTREGLFRVLQASVPVIQDSYSVPELGFLDIQVRNGQTCARVLIGKLEAKMKNESERLSRFREGGGDLTCGFGI